MKNLILAGLMLWGLQLAAQTGPVNQLIQKAGDSAAHPGASHVIIFDSTRVDMQESGLSYYNEHKLIKILNVQGAKKFTTYKYDYDPLSAFAEIQKVIIYYSNGHQKVLTLQDELDYPAPAGTILWGARQKMVELGKLDPGDAFEVFLFKKGFTYALLAQEGEDDERYIPPMRGHYYDIVPFWSDVPLLKKVYQALIPNTKTIQYQVYNGKLKVSKQNLGDKTQYDFSLSAITPVKTEPNMVAASDVAPKLLISTAPDWFAKSKWFYGVNEDYGSFESTPEIDRKVNEILAEATSEIDSVSRLTHWVADEIRYFGLSMGKGEGFTLHNGIMNFTDRCGVCKDKASMLITMLRSAGFEAYPSMTMAGSRIDRIPADQFNHSVAVVRLSDGKLHPLDPTWVPFVRELWSSAEQQQNYLPGLPEGSDLLETPLSPPENHFVKINNHSNLQTDGTLTGEIAIEAEGQSDASLRRMFTGSFKALWQENLENELLAICPQAIIDSVDYGIDPYNYMAGPILLKLRYRIPDYALISDKEIIFTPLAASGIFKRAMGQLYIDTTPGERTFPFRDRCSRRVEIEDNTALPSGFSVAWLPELTDIEGSGASFQGAFSVEKGHLKLTETATFYKRIYQPQDWSSFRQAVEMQKRIADNPVILKNEI
jgi:hypothetical protein